MSEIQIYVKTSALGGDGIHWRNASKPDQPREIPPIINPDEKESYIVPSTRNPTGSSTVEPLVLDEKPSIMIVSHLGQLFLEVTGIEATSERSNKLGRKIFDVIAWLANNNEDNSKVFRKIAAKALLGFSSNDETFADAIKNSVTFKGKDAFVVNTSSLANLAMIEPSTNSCLSGDQILDNVWIQSAKIINLNERNSNEEVQTLIDRILLQPLPGNFDPFVFVIKKEKEKEKEKECIQYSMVNLSKKAVPNDPKEHELFIPGSPTSENGKTQAQVKKERKIQPMPQLAIFLLGILAGVILGLAIAVVLLEAKIPFTWRSTSGTEHFDLFPRKN
jgi:hypothetical protein